MNQCWSPRIACLLSDNCEHVEILFEEQSGFRPNHSTTDIIFVMYLYKVWHGSNQLRFSRVLSIHQSLQLHQPNIPLEITRPFWRPVEDYNAYPSIPRWHARMRARARVVKSLARVCACEPVKYFLCGGNSCGPHTFRGGKRRHRPGGPQHENRCAGAGDSNG